MRPRVNIYLLGKKGLIALKALNRSQLKLINQVVIGRDKNVKKDYSEDITLFCNKHKINNRAYDNLAVNEYDVDYHIAIGWRWLIRADENKLIVFHDSLLPKLRGFNPLVTALINGDTTIGATVLKGSEEFDRGDIYFQEFININYPIKISQAIDIVANIYGSLMVKLFESIENNTLNSFKQDEEKASYSLWRDKEDYFIDWNKDAHYIKRFIDAVGYPYDGACTVLDQKIVKIYDAEVIKDVNIENRVVGKVLFKDPNNNAVTIVCGKGLLKVKDFYDENNHRIIIDKFRIRFG
jgi:methionyl-tRNA formyltransferase